LERVNCRSNLLLYLSMSSPRHQCIPPKTTER
jgi:hypothetical protein